MQKEHKDHREPDPIDLLKAEFEKNYPGEPSSGCMGDDPWDDPEQEKAFMDSVKKSFAKMRNNTEKERPWLAKNELGEESGGMCCQRGVGGVCYEHNVENYYPENPHAEEAIRRKAFLKLTVLERKLLGVK
jgi:hypothetical protein